MTALGSGVTLSNQAETAALPVPSSGAGDEGVPMNEERIFNKLDAIEQQGGQALVEIGKIQEQIKAIPDHESRIRALEQWRWGLVGVSGLLVTGFTTYASARGGA